MNNPSVLRAHYPSFHYLQSDYSWQSDNLQIAYEYLIEPDLKFKHSLVFKNLPESARDIPDYILKTYVDHLGLAEIFNYWKLTASPQIYTKAVWLDEKQQDFWLKLLINGMGEYFYVNQIDFTEADFVKIQNLDTTEPAPAPTNTPPEDQETKILIPIGGGKDSVVTLEVFKKNFPQENLGVLLVNPTPASRDIARLSQLKTIEVARTLDSKLFELNAKGFLNGHIPISSVFAFIGILAAKLHGFTDVAFSNERSSNEGNVEFHGQTINHQYSKSFQFESDFRNYQADLYRHTGVINYFSFLRPLYELQIAKRFSRLENYHSAFRSCNRGQKTNSWCGECPKCLFAFMILYPFIAEDKLVEYFGKNLFEDEKLYPLLLALIGRDKNKPFECVGTFEESLATLYLGIKKARSQRPNLPVLLEKAEQEILKSEPNLEERSNQILNSWNQENRLPQLWQEWLKDF